MYYLLLVFASVLLAADFALNKIYQKENGTSYEAGYRFNTLMGLFTAIIFLAANRFEFEFTWYSCIMAFLMTVFATSYNLIGFRLLKDGSMAMYTLFLMAGGMVVPYAVGIAFLHEQITLMRIFALVLILAGVIIPNCTAKDFNKKRAEVARLSSFLPQQNRKDRIGSFPTAQKSGRIATQSVRPQEVACLSKFFLY